MLLQLPGQRNRPGCAGCVWFWCLTVFDIVDTVPYSFRADRTIILLTMFPFVIRITGAIIGRRANHQMM
jgi:hypothetical protein